MTTVAQLLAEAREHIDRVEPSELRRRVGQGALVVDIRPAAQRQLEGQLGFGVIIERNVLEWRFDLEGPDCIPEIQSRDQEIIVVCSEGYASSLAAASLGRLGYTHASDLIGGFRAWHDWADRADPSEGVSADSVRHADGDGFAHGA